MSWNNDPAMQALRLTYNAAVDAHATCARALTEAVIRGEQPSAALIEAEARAKARLHEARAKLHATMLGAMTGDSGSSLTTARRTD
jgi:hypothetical protein